METDSTFDGQVGAAERADEEEWSSSSSDSVGYDCERGLNATTHYRSCEYASSSGSNPARPNIMPASFGLSPNPAPAPGKAEPPPKPSPNPDINLGPTTSKTSGILIRGSSRSKTKIDMSAHASMMARRQPSFYRVRMALTRPPFAQAAPVENDDVDEFDF